MERGNLKAAMQREDGSTVTVTGITVTHLLLAFLATLAAVVILAVAGDQNLGGTLQVIDALTGLLLIEGGALAGSQVPSR